MPKPNVLKSDSGGSEEVSPEFSAHAVPTNEQIRAEEIEESLTEIYQDDKGGMVDVSKLDFRKKRGFFYYLFTTIIFFSVVGGGLWYAYKRFYVPRQTSTDAVELAIEAPKEIISGKEFTYTVNYKNLNNVDIKNIQINLAYPTNFIFLESSPLANVKNNTWKIDNLPAHRSGSIEIKGKIIGAVDNVGVVIADMAYMPVNFSSEFKKESTWETVVADVGFDFNVTADNSALVNEDNEIVFDFQKKHESYINNFRLSVAGSGNLVLGTSTAVTGAELEKIKDGSWLVKNLQADAGEVKLKVKFKEKKIPAEEVLLAVDYSEDGNDYYKFFEKKIAFDIIKNELNLNLILNGSRSDQGMDFGQTLNYSIVYANNGEEELKDVVIMAVLNSDILDWSTLDDKNKGKVMGNTISWSKEEIPQLASTTKGTEGTIDFSLKVLPINKVRLENGKFDLTKKYEVQSYIQFTVGNKTMGNRDDMKSNIIVSKVNSDLKLDEQVRYFNSDNIAVGSGPLPPKVGEITSYRVYWKLTNNLHELNNLKVESILPQYVQWTGGNTTAVGSVNYDETTRKVTWDIGRLPNDVYEVAAEFSISINPVEDDKDKILVLLPSASGQAVDSVTGAEIKIESKPKTTKLEDDEIANSDGRVVGK